MILDLQSVFSGATTAAGVTTGQAVTATAISTNVIDLRNAATPVLADEGISGCDLWLIIVVDVTTTSGGATTLQVNLESDSTADLATSATVHWASPIIAKATLVAGYTIARTQLPSGDYERYLGVRYTVATGPFTAGSFRAFLTPDPQRNVIYPGSFTLDV